MKKMKHRNKMKLLLASSAILGTLGSVGTPIVLNTVTAHADTVPVNTVSQQAFINSIAPSAQKIASQNNMYASVMIAQAILESGWGKSTLSQAPNYNLFGVKGIGSAGTINLPTHEENAQGVYSINAGFKKYSSFDDSFIDNARVITGNPIYQSALKPNATTYQMATAALQGTYATSTRYASILNSIIQRYNLTQYDTAPAQAQTTTQPQQTVQTAPTVQLTDQQIMDKYNVKPDYMTKQVSTENNVTYKTVKGDDFWKISGKYDVPLQQLMDWNSDVSDVRKLPIGKTLIVGKNTVNKTVYYRDNTNHNYETYTVKSGDNLWRISQNYHTTVDDLMKLNNFNSNYMLHPGDQIKVKDTQSTSEHDLTDAEKSQADADALNKAKALYSADQAKAAVAASASQQQTTTAQPQQTNASTDATISYDKTNVSQQRQQVIALASKEIGVPYVWGGTTPSGFDCSGLTQYVFKNALNMDITRTTYTQQNVGTRIPVSQARPGDLYFWSDGGSTYHVGIAIGNGQYIAAPRPGETVHVQSIQYFMPQFAQQIVQ